MPHLTNQQDSEKKKSTSSLEKALIASEIRYRRLFESAKEGILILDAQTGMIVDVNPFLIELLGYSKESFIEKTIWEIGFFKDIIDNKDKFLELQRDKYVRYEDLPLETADGRKINVEFVSNVYLVNNQNVIQCNIRDITKRKVTEAGLEKTRKELAEIKVWADEESNLTENLINTVREPLLVLDEKLRVIKASRSFYNTFKVNPENTIGKLIYELGNHQWDIPKLRELLEKILPEKTSFDNYEVAHDFSSIGKRIMLLNARQIKRGLGKDKVILLALEDVTERRREERSLSEKSRLNSEYLNILLSNAHAPIIIWDASLLIKRFNHEFEKLSGYTMSEVKDKKIEMLFPKNEVASTLKFIKNNINNETPELIELNILTKDKKIRTVLWNSANISDEEGQNTVATIAQDITSRKQSEIELSNSEIRYRRLFESAKDGILILDAKTGMIVDVNPFLIKLLGYSKESFIEKPVWEIGFFKDIAQNKEKFLELQQAEYVRYENLPLETSNGRKIHVEFVSNVYLSDNKKVIQCNIRDITEQKKLETNLSTAAEIAKLGYWEFDVQSGNFIFNDQYYRLIHGSSTEKQGGNIMSAEEFARRLVHPDDAKRVAENLQEAISSPDPEYLGQSEARVFRDNGDITIVNVRFKMEKDDRGQTMKVVGVNQDITERKRVEETLIKLSSAIEQTFDTIVITDHNGIIEYVNQAFVDKTGYSMEEALGKTPRILKSGAKDQKYYKEMWKIILSGNVFRTEVINKKKNGDLYYEQKTISPIFDKDKIITHFVGTGIDITDRKRNEKEITMLAHALKSINECVSITDTEDKIIFVNESFLKTYGYLENDLIGKNINILRSQNNQAKLVEEVLPDTLKEGWKGEVWNKRKDGSEFPIYLSATTINDKNGKTIGIIGVASDITAQKRFRQELINAKERAEESDRLKSAFLANMSHEIRTPMNGILGFAQLLKDTDLTGAEMQEYLSMIEKSGERMLNIITAIVNISKIESGQMETIITEININELINFIYSFFKPNVEEKGMRIFTNTALPAKESIIKSDKEKIYAILTNLVANAAKFTHAGSIEFGYEKKGRYLEFFVKDTGDGIADKNKEFIFTRFRQGSESLTRNYEGAGLGLSISKAYVEMLGGKIWVESELGKGSTFYFTIPCNTESESTTKTKKAVSARLNEGLIKNLKIMVAEDDEASVLFLIKALNITEEKILIARNGIEAVEVCLNNPDLDLVLMDIKMPVMGGYQATKQIRQFNKEVIIIGQSAFGLLGDREKAIEAGCNSYITKPIDIKLLRALIREHCTI